MKCRICSGDLKFKNNVYVCENCGSRQTIFAFFENTEVYLCYIENDMQGRRSRDSVIAQDLYSKLEGAQIHTFYQRISAADLTENDLETANTVAFDHAKVIVVIATTVENFQMLIEKYGEKFAEKRVIPVYADMNANDIPKELKHLQAVNYNAVGASVDFVKNVSRILGKEQEVDITDATKKHMSRKKRTVFVSVFVILALMLSATAYVVFGTPYVLKSKKYAYAENLYEIGGYEKAIEILTALPDYKNSAGLLKNIYDKYDGYYNNEDETVSLYINIIDNLRAEIEIRRIDENKKMAQANFSAMINGNSIDLQFTDSHGNIGSGTIVLTDTGVSFSTEMQDFVKEPSVGNLNLSFSLDNKATAPIERQITAEDLISWITQKTSKEDLYALGLELENEDADIYRIANTDIKLLFSNIDFYNYKEGQVDAPRLENEIIDAIQAPASILLPDRVGTSTSGFIQDDILFAPYAEVKPFREAIIPIQLGENRGAVIEQDTPVYMISKSILGDYHWWNPTDYCVNWDPNTERSGLKYIIDEDQNSLWVYDKDIEWLNDPLDRAVVTYTLYQIDKSNLQAAFVAEKTYETVNPRDTIDSLTAQFLQEFYYQR